MQENMYTIDKDSLFRYFRGQATDAEIDSIDTWLGESDTNRKLYKEASVEFEIMTMHASSKSIRHADICKKKERMKTVARFILNAAAVIALFFFARWGVEYSFNRELDRQPISVMVPAGQRMNLSLADGTMVELNAGARFEYPALFRGKERNVRLEGEAVFHVTHDEKKPFIVNTFAAEVKVLGTEFNVYADAREQEFSTTLVQGKVMVTSKADPDQSLTLLPDHRVSMTNGKFRVEATEAAEAVLWTSGILDISGGDFRKLITRMEKAYGVKIIIEKEEIPEIDCSSGKVRISDGIDHALNILSLLSDFEYVKDTGTGTIYIR